MKVSLNQSIFKFILYLYPFVCSSPSRVTNFQVYIILKIYHPFHINQYGSSSAKEHFEVFYFINKGKSGLIENQKKIWSVGIP